MYYAHEECDYVQLVSSNNGVYLTTHNMSASDGHPYGMLHRIPSSCLRTQVLIIKGMVCCAKYTHYTLSLEGTKCTTTRGPS